MTDEGCPANSPSATLCRAVSVSCPGIGATTAHIRQAGAGSRGSAVFTSGGMGTDFYRSYPSPAIASFFSSLLSEGWRAIEVAWSAPGIWDGQAPKTSACRYATVLRWIYGNIHGTGKSAPFIAVGFSAGASQVAFGIAYYDSAAILDLAVLASGPIFLLGPPYCAVPCLEPLMSGTPLLAYQSTAVASVLGAADTLTNVLPNAKLYHEAITTRKSIEVLAGIDHLVPLSQPGSDAILRAIHQMATR